MVKLSCAEMKCEGRLRKMKEKYMMCANPDLIDDMLFNASMWCDPPENRINDIDMIELMSPKGKIIQKTRSNDEDILDIEISE